MSNSLLNNVIYEPLKDEEKASIINLVDYVRSEEGFMVANTTMADYNDKHNPHFIEQDDPSFDEPVKEWLSAIKDLNRSHDLSQITLAIAKGLCDFIQHIGLTKSLAKQYDKFKRFIKDELNIDCLYISLQKIIVRLEMDAC